MSIHKLIIIGSGPAGHTAAVYAARGNLKPVMIEGIVKGGVAGGQLMITTDVENYPGFPEGIAGPKLMELFKRQSARFGTEIISADALASATRSATLVCADTAAAPSDAATMSCASCSSPGPHSTSDRRP